MLFSLRLNNDLPVGMYAELAQAAERAGFDQFWVSNDLFLRSVWVLLTSAAQATQRIRIGTCIVNPYTLHPAEIAMAAATLNELSNGRFLLGVSSGADDFLGWIGIRAERPVTAVAETMAALRRLWRGDREHPVGQFAGVRHWSSDAYLRIPTQNIAVYVGAMSPRMLRLIGSDADGGLPLLFPPEHFIEAMRYIRDGVEQAGRSMSDVDVAACIWCSIASDRPAAEAVMREKIAYYGHAFSPLILSRLGLTQADFDPIQRELRAGSPRSAAALVTPTMLQIGVVGTSGDLLPRLERLVAHGARHLSFGPPLGPNLVEAIETLGREVLPYFRGH